jgi:hypothetical protein
MTRHTSQYTIRSIPERVDRALRQKARQERKSLNQVALEALAAGTGVADTAIEYHDLDALAGTWIEDKAFDGALTALDQIDDGLWK